MIQVAQILKSNGTDGELVMSFRDIDPEDIQKNEPVYVCFDGLPVPFFIESLVKRGNTKALVHLTDIRSFDDAEELVGHPVWMKEEDLGEEEYDDDDYSWLVGWTLLDAPEGKKGGATPVGPITDFIDIPSNPCIEVETKNGAVIVPLHEDLIIEVRERKEEIVLRIPEGLL